MKLSDHFLNFSLKERDYLTIELCQEIVERNEYSEVQKDGRIRYWGYLLEYDKYLRVVVERDYETILTAHFDRNFKKNLERIK